MNQNYTEMKQLLMKLTRQNCPNNHIKTYDADEMKGYQHNKTRQSDNRKLNESFQRVLLQHCIYKMSPNDQQRTNKVLAEQFK